MLGLAVYGSGIDRETWATTLPLSPCHHAACETWLWTLRPSYNLPEGGFLMKGSPPTLLCTLPRNMIRFVKLEVPIGTPTPLLCPNYPPPPPVLCVDPPQNCETGKVPGLRWHNLQEGACGDGLVLSSGARGQSHFEYMVWRCTTPPEQHRRRSRSSVVMHVTPELEVLGSNPGGVGTQCPRR